MTDRTTAIPTGRRKKHRNKVKARRALRALMASYTDTLPMDHDVYPPKSELLTNEHRNITKKS